MKYVDVVLARLLLRKLTTDVTTVQLSEEYECSPTHMGSLLNRTLYSIVDNHSEELDISYSDLWQYNMRQIKEKLSYKLVPFVELYAKKNKPKEQNRIKYKQRISNKIKKVEILLEDIKVLLNESIRVEK